MEAWDARASELHRIDLNDLKNNGEHVTKVCASLNAALGQFDVYSDAQSWDGFWLMRLFDAGGMRPKFKLNDFGLLMKRFIGKRDEEFNKAVSGFGNRRHRAGPDAAYLRNLFEIARGLQF